MAQAPVTLESRTDASGSGEAVITNLSSVPLTAYLLQVFLEPCSPAQRPAVFRVADAVLTPGGTPLLPSQVRSEPLGAARCNKVGVSVPARAELKAAIYQDGTSFGEPKWVESLLDNRRFQLEQVEIVLTALKARRAGSAPGPVSAADLDAALATSNTRKTAPFPSVLDVRELAQQNLAGEVSSLPDRIARTINLFEQLRDRLLDARPSLR